MKNFYVDRFILQSIIVHVLIILFFILFVAFSTPSKNLSLVEFRMIEGSQNLKESKVMPLKSAPLAVPLKEKPLNKKKKGREVFGVTKKSIKSTELNSLKTKQGNTIAKEVDQKKLKEEDEDALPIPEEEYIVSAMPRVISEFRAPYPDEAKKMSIEGKVVMDVLVDEFGQVRKVTLVSGPGHGLNEAAMISMKKFKFNPAKIGEKAVAVVIRYGINFVLED